MDEHHGLIHRPGALGIVDKGLIVFKGQAHPANDDDIGIGLIGNPHQKGIIGFSWQQKKWEFSAI